MAIEYRSPSADEGIVPALSATYRAFGEEIRDYDREQLPKLMPTDRIHCALDGGGTIGTTAAYAFEMTIPGGQLPTGGVTWVGVLPSHRRRGVMSELMRRQIHDLHDRGEPLAALWASESAIYGRFGYGIAAPPHTLRGDTRTFGLRGNPEPVGSVRLVERDEAREKFPPIHETVRPTVPGMLTRTEDMWDVYRLADEDFMRNGAGPKFFALYERDGESQGYASYRIKSSWGDNGVPQGELRVNEAFATTPVATRELWRFLFSVDLVANVGAFLFDPGSPLFLSVTDPRRIELKLSDGLWLRLVDAEAALRARSYAAGGGSVVLEVTDELCPWNAGRYRVGEGAERTDADADLRLDVADLASAYLGAFDFEHLARALRVEELRPGALARASALFRTPRPPFCPEIF
jgi:predicted acetyltransferase